MVLKNCQRGTKYNLSNKLWKQTLSYAILHLKQTRMLLQYYEIRYNIPRAPRQSQTLSEDCGKLGRRSSQNLPLSKAIDFSSSRFTADFATVHRKDILPYDLRFFSPSGTTEPCQNIGLLKSGIFLQIYGAEPGFSPDVVPCFLLWNKGSTWEITEAPAYLNTSPYRPLFCIIEAQVRRETERCWRRQIYCS